MQFELKVYQVTKPDYKLVVRCLIIRFSDFMCYFLLKRLYEALSV